MMLGWATKQRSTAMSNKSNLPVATMGIDIGKNAFHVVGLDRRGAIVLRQRWSRGQVETRLANMPPCLIGMEACVGAHHLSRRLQLQGHDTRLIRRNTCALLEGTEERFSRRGSDRRGSAAPDNAIRCHRPPVSLRSTDRVQGSDHRIGWLIWIDGHI
jgi:hypothetical protein